MNLVVSLCVGPSIDIVAFQNISPLAVYFTKCQEKCSWLIVNLVNQTHVAICFMILYHQPMETMQAAAKLDTVLSA